MVFLNSPMVSGDRNKLLQNCLQTVKMKIDALYSADSPVALFFFKPMQARGCAGHPSVEDHAILADELLPFFRTLLNK